VTRDVKFCVKVDYKHIYELCMKCWSVTSSSTVALYWPTGFYWSALCKLFTGTRKRWTWTSLL